jgi:NADPH:quinone reductase-like Zn-dependent oxidoreductase
MKAVRYHEHGDVDVLRYEDAERPSPAAGQVLVQVAATSFNPVDAGIRAGYLQQVFPVRFPHVPGLDVAGTVVEIGPEVSTFAVGDAVFGFLPMTENGAAAEFAVAPASALTAAPKSIPLAAAAAVPGAALTAWQALFEHAGLQPGQRVLINGAGGGVGGYAVQLAKQSGAVVIATASPRSSAAVLTQGADQIVDYTAERLTEAVTEPVDVVVNLAPATEAEMAALVGLVTPGGVLVTTTTAGPEDAERKVRAISMYVHSDAEQLATIADWIDSGRLTVDIYATYPLADLAEVHRLGGAGSFRGKVIVVPNT